jgi:hypothetical protein
MRSVQDGLDTRADTKNFFDGLAEIRSRPFKGPDPARLLNSVKIASFHMNYLLLPQLCVGSRIHSSSSLSLLSSNLYPKLLLKSNNRCDVAMCAIVIHAINPHCETCILLKEGGFEGRGLWAL